MSAILHYVLLQWGLTWFVTSASIVSPLRIALLRRSKFALGMYCVGCVGFWVGLSLRAVHVYPWPMPFVFGLEAGFVGSATSLLLYLFASPGDGLEVEAQMAGLQVVVKHAPADDQ